MTPLRYARDRLDSLLKEIHELKDLDFPYEDARAALDRLEAVFGDSANLLKQLDSKSDSNVVQAVCSASLHQAFRDLPLLGFILRCTDTRNAFEVFGPLLRLAKQLLGAQTKLILSSEWNFSPHVYSGIEELPDHVLMGLPASESGNPLLVALAGHELGHAVWKKHRLSNAVIHEIQETISKEGKLRAKEYTDAFGGQTDDLLFKTNIAPAEGWALKQAEETFCDFLGVRIFSEAYLHAFAYLLTPGTRSSRTATYPEMRRRVRQLKDASAFFGVAAPSDYDSWFVDDVAPTDAKAVFLLALADTAATKLTSELLQQAKTLADAAAIPARQKTEIDRVLDAFQYLTPAAGIGSLTSLLNAAWQAYHDQPNWLKSPDIDARETLSELLLKSIEILEIEQRISGVAS